MKTIPIAISLVSLAAAACGTTGPTPQLLDARRAYDTARTSPEAQYSPDRVLEAKQALDRAEYAHKENPGSFQEKSLAYVAERRAELAVVYGDYERDVKAHEAADAQYKTREDQLRREAQGEAAETRRELQGTRAELGTVQGDLKDAQRTAAAAVASLHQIANVKEDARGTVITLDGSVLFVTGKSELTPLAEQKLADVAKALNQTDQNITIEGHTDSQGSDATNLRLSQDRADAVRSYLVQQGVPGDRITAIGKGKADPIASNDTPEGRANNRRVEIVLQKKSAQ
ncbi:MAG TPA: OmpA family protein [Polyangiaceae bacterium]|nr:OmpA family protein [Polyangiaceae bacterium]